MATVNVQVELACCSNPGCDQLGTKQCSACKTTPYCGPICQTADWMHHKEECPGHLRKMGLLNLEKARGLHPDNPQRLRFAELALTKLKLLKDRPLEEIDDAFAFKTTSLRFLGRHTEAMESAKERYTMWAMTNIRNPRSIWAAFDLIDCCMHINEFVDAELFARTALEIINERTDNIIPPDQRQETLARGSHYLAEATYHLAVAGGIAPEAKHAAGVKTIALAREALEISTRLFGSERPDAAMNMLILADALDYFNDVNDDEVLRLYEQSKVKHARLLGNTSLNVAVSEAKLGTAYVNREKRARNAHDLDGAVANLQLALPHFHEAARIYRATNHLGSADRNLREAVRIEKFLRLAEFSRATAAAAAAVSRV